MMLLEEKYPSMRPTHNIATAIVQHELARLERALFLLMQAIPCILHMEMRVGLKIFMMLLLDGLAAVKDSTLTFPLAKTEKQRVKPYV